MINENEKFDHVIILASGSGERVEQYTVNNKIPKILMSIGNETIFSSMMKDIDEVTEERPVITLKPTHEDIINEVDDLTYKKEPLIIQCSSHLGTAYTLYEALDFLDQYAGLKYNHKILVVWSDILEESSESLKPFREMINNLHDLDDLSVCIGLDNKPRHRYSLVNNVINESPSNNGNVAGCYAFNYAGEFFIHLKNRYELQWTGTDFDEVMKNYDLIDIIKMENEACNLEITEPMYFNFIDIGDEVKYKDFMSPERTSTRYFNKIDIGEKTVTKTALTERGKEIMTNEVNFLNEVRKMGVDSFVDVLESVVEDGKQVSYTMPKLYSTAHEIISGTKNLELINNIFKDFCNDIKKVHDKSRAVGDDLENRFYKLCHNEYIETTLKRVNSIKSLLKSMEITRFNGRPIPDINYLMLKVDDFIKVYTKYQTNNLTVIHGDTNTSNVMYEEDTGRTVFIDPRGHFGGEKMFGDSNYDIAKFVYGMTGYEALNRSNDFVLDIEDGNLVDNLNSFLTLDKFDNRVVSTEIKIIVGIIWIKLSTYIINNPTKSIYAYYKGVSIVDFELNRL